jgi:hypothetical protein
MVRHRRERKKKMIKKLVVSTIFMAGTWSLFTNTSRAVEMRAATASEYVGVWRLINIPDSKMGIPGANDKSPFRGPCQFFIVDGDGDWWSMHFETASGEVDSKKNCPKTLSEVKSLFAISSGGSPKTSAYKWKIVNPSLGLLTLTTRSSITIWKIDRVQKDSQADPEFGIDLKEGDILTQVLKPVDSKSLQFLWGVILRPVLP